MRGLPQLAALLAACCVAAPPDDWHYPSEEPAEAAALRPPELVSATGTDCTLRQDGATRTVPVGGAFGEWQVLAALPAAPPAAVLQQDFGRWGSLVVVTQSAAPLVLRKAVGQLGSLRQPYFNFSASIPDYFSKVTASLADLPGEIALNRTADGEADYPGMASVLAPQRDIAEVSLASDVSKFIVTHNGRVKCASYHGATMNGITDFDDLHAALPNGQTVVFDPAEHLSFWPSRFENTKTGLVGGHLPIANVGSFSPSAGKGFELLAFAPVSQGASAASPPPVNCSFSGPFADSYVADCSAGCRGYGSLPEAEAGCAAEPSCGGITLRRGRYELRAAGSVSPSPSGETAWLLSNAADCHVLPRQPGINYSPSVYVALREQNSSAFGSYSYWLVGNGTKRGAGAGEWWGALLGNREWHSRRLAGAMTVALPDSDRRQGDMARYALLSASNNFVGNQSNYGNGGTYWSYGREDNGSLPLNILSVDSALIDWGVCEPALAHVSFYFGNYVNADGSINYYTWGNTGDSVGDTGRLVDLYLQAVALCPTEGWGEKYLPVVERFGRLMLRQRAAAAAAPGAAPKGCAGLLQGAPEHDWSSVKGDYFFNNNVWVLRGMERLGAFLTDGTGGRNATLGRLLLSDAAAYRQAIMSCVAACTVRGDGGKAVFLPPYAELDAKPFTSMTDSRTSEYSNFRFYSESLLADVLPRENEDLMLQWHNARGGRVGGASRFSRWLDDMPTAGWGYGALTNNRTADFLALLYGHMATYQSRGTFHSTEQLAFTGEGWYRDWLHWPNPAPNGSATAAGVPAVTATGRSGRAAALGYYAPENDVSFCVVSQVLAARLTRWQLVLETPYRTEGGAREVWLARGAPRRWFRPAAAGGGFSVAAAPTQFGRVSYEVTVPSEGTAAFAVTPPQSAASAGVLWKLRWPGAVKGPVRCQGCTVVVPPAAGSGVAAVTADGHSFTATAEFS